MLKCKEKTFRNAIANLWTYETTHSSNPGEYIDKLWCTSRNLELVNMECTESIHNVIFKLLSKEGYKNLSCVNSKNCHWIFITQLHRKPQILWLGSVKNMLMSRNLKLI